MSELRTNVFFRPWHMPENEASGIVTVDNTLDSGLPYGKPEDDNESVVSSTTASSSTVSTVVETPDKYDDRLSDQGTADSTSSDVARCTRTTARLHCRGSSCDHVATSTTPCFVVEDDVDGTAATTRSPRVFRPRRSAESKSPRDSAEYNGAIDVCSLKYLSSLRQLPRTTHDTCFAPSRDPPYSTADVIAGPSSSAAMIPELYYAGFADFPAGLQPGNQPGIHPGVHPAIQPGIHPAILPAGFYTRSMEEAVQMVHRQDVAAKQMKKMRPKKFRCQYCDVAFSNNGQLKGHVRIHTGERPFKCDVESCGKSFTRNEELTRHKRIHTGVRPHSCVVCGKRFGRKDHLKKHTRTHEVRDPYRLSAAALDMFALGHSFHQAAGLAPYVYPI